MRLLIKDWDKALLWSWSMWCVYASFACDLVPYAIPYLDNYIPSWLSVALLMLSPLLRVFKQKKVRRHADQ